MTGQRGERRNAAAGSERGEPLCGACGHARRMHVNERGVCFECRPASNFRRHAGWCNRYRRPRPEGDDNPAVIRHWTGREVNALRCAVRMSVREFAEHLGVSARAVSRWAKLGASTVPRPYMQAILNAALAGAEEATQRRFDTFLSDTTTS